MFLVSLMHLHLYWDILYHIRTCTFLFRKYLFSMSVWVCDMYVWYGVWACVQKGTYKESSSITLHRILLRQGLSLKQELSWHLASPSNSPRPTPWLWGCRHIMRILGFVHELNPSPHACIVHYPLCHIVMIFSSCGILLALEKSRNMKHFRFLD